MEQVAVPRVGDLEKAPRSGMANQSRKRYPELSVIGYMHITECMRICMYIYIYYFLVYLFIYLSIYLLVDRQIDK